MTAQCAEEGLGYCDFVLTIIEIYMYYFAQYRQIIELVRNNYKNKNIGQPNQCFDK